MPLARLDSVAGAGLLAIGDAGRIQGAPDNLVTNTRQVLDSAASDEDDGVFLQVVPLTGDVRSDFHAVGEAHTGDLPQSRVRLLRSNGGNTSTDATTLRCGDLLLVSLTGLETRSGHFLLGLLAALAYELIGIRHGGGYYTSCGLGVISP